MKKMYLFLLLSTLFCSLQAYAITHVVTVQNFQFSPSNLTVNVGDFIEWNWVNGTHTTTSLSIPVGAASWDEEITSTTTTYTYEVTAAGSYQYECTIHSGFMSGAFTATVLPLELHSFTGRVAGATNWLYWETLTEKDVQSHILEHSADGKQWTEVGRRAGSVNSSVAISYELEDPKPFNQTYYRLRSVDTDGKSSISKIILLGEPFSISNVFPNPATDRVTIQFVAVAEESLRLSVLDMSGRLVWYQTVETKSGLNTTMVPFRQMRAGTYDLTLTNGKRIAASLRVVKE